MAVRASRKLRDNTKSRVGWLQIRERTKAALADGLIPVDLRQIGLVHGSRANVLRTHAECASKLMLDSDAPLHEIRCVEFARRDCCDSNWRKTSSRIGLR